MARRTRLSFLNAQAALEALPRVIDIMAAELNWDESRKQKEYQDTFEFLGTMGLFVHHQPQFSTTLNNVNELALKEAFLSTPFLPSELAKYKEIFDKFDHDREGSINQQNLSKALINLGLDMKSEEIEAAIREVNLNNFSSIEFNEFLEVIDIFLSLLEFDRFWQLLRILNLDPNSQGLLLITKIANNLLQLIVVVVVFNFLCINTWYTC